MLTLKDRPTEVHEVFHINAELNLLTLQSFAIEAVSGVPVLAEFVVIAICPSKVGIGDDCVHDAPTNC